MRKIKDAVHKALLFGAACSLACAAFLPLSIQAGTWQQNEKGYWWQESDGSFPASRWVLLDGNRDGTAEYYYFKEDGYLLTDAKTPDFRTVNADGALTRHGQTVTRKVKIYNPNGAIKPHDCLEPSLPLSLLGKNTDELQAHYGEELRLIDKADSLEYFSVDSLPGYEFAARRGIVKKILTTPEYVLTDFEETKSVARMAVLLGAAGMLVDADTDFMLKAYYSGYEFLFEYRDGGSVGFDSRVVISLDEP